MLSRKSKKQSTVALSCKAERMALAAAKQEGLYLVQLMSDLGAMYLGYHHEE